MNLELLIQSQAKSRQSWHQSSWQVGYCIDIFSGGARYCCSYAFSVGLGRRLSNLQCQERETYGTTTIFYEMLSYLSIKNINHQSVKAFFTSIFLSVTNVANLVSLELFLPVTNWLFNDIQRYTNFFIRLIVWCYARNDLKFTQRSIPVTLSFLPLVILGILFNLSQISDSVVVCKGMKRRIHSILGGLSA